MRKLIFDRNSSKPKLAGDLVPT